MSCGGISACGGGCGGGGGGGGGPVGSGVQIVGMMGYGISQAIRNVKEHRMASYSCIEVGSVKPDIVHGIVSSANPLTASDPMQPDTWRVDLSPVSRMARKHKHQWEPDVHLRRSGRSLLSNPRGTWVMDQIEDITMKLALMQINIYSKAGNKVANVCADTFTERTHYPMYINEKGTYPLIDLGNQQSLGFLRDFRLGGVSSYTVYKRYHSKHYRAELLVATGLVNDGQAAQLLKFSFVKFGFSGGIVPRVKDNIGAKMHGELSEWDKLIVVSMACQGSFQGKHCWDAFWRVMVQGGWPWLRQWPKRFGKLLFSVMAGIFAALRHGAVIPNVGALLMILATKLVGSPDGTQSTWRVRTADRLNAAKTSVEMPDPEKDKEKDHDEVENPAPRWTLGQNPPLVPLQIPEHIVVGSKCNHGTNLSFTGRLRLAHSLSELASHVEDGNQITVADTVDNCDARAEVHMYAIQQRLLMVCRGDNQCVACAFRLAHTIGALVVST